MISKAIFRFPPVRCCRNVERNCNSRIFHYGTYGENSQVPLNIFSSENDDPDKFGTLSQPKNQYDFVKPDRNEIIEDEKMEKKISRRYDHDIQCTKQIKNLLKQRKVSEALSILDNGEISKPEGYVYGLLIQACGNVGYTKKAFKLYNEMKKRGIKPRPSVYTSLFNACSNSPWKEDTLSRATHLLNSLEDKGYEPNDINYNAMIKAFGRGGDIARAFCLVDQMIDRGIQVASSTFAFLLQACASDKEAGFRHAVIVWDKMLKNGISPTVYTFNLLLRCCKDCGCGEGIDLDKLSSHDSIIQIPGRNTSFNLERKDILTLPVNFNEESLTSASSVDSERIIVTKVNKHIEIEKLNQHEGVGTIMNNFLNPASPQDRLLSVGGCVGFLEQMAAKNVRPNIKTFTQLLDVIPLTESAEKELMLALEENDLEKDIEFYNMLMKKKTMSFDYEGAKAVLPMISTEGLTPNIMTFGILAMGCKNKNDTRKFIAQMKEAGYRLNAEIVGTLIRNACLHWQIYHVLELMDVCIKEEVRPNARLLQHLNGFKVKIRNAVKEERVNESIHNSSKISMKAYEIYNKRLHSWLKEIDLTEAEELHPWTQFRRHFKKQENGISETKHQN